VNTVILGWGTAVPAGQVSQADAADHAVAHWGAVHEQGRTISMLYRRSGVSTRHSVLVETSSNGSHATQSFYRVAHDRLDRGPTTRERMLRYEADALDLAELAARRALADSAVMPQQVTHLIVVSCSGLSSPGVDLGLIDRLELPPTTVRTNIGFMGCHGAFNGLRLAGAFANADPAARVLIVCVELCSIHQQYSAATEQLVANALFGDGAAAVLCAASSPAPSQWSVMDQHSYVLPGTAGLMGWRIGDHGFQMTLSPEVPEVIGRHLSDNIATWLAKRGLTLDGVRTWAIHPGGPRILQACAQSLGLEPSALDVSRETLSRFGNMSSPTILFILRELQQQQRPLPCVALAFGPGLTIEAALLDRDG
jgi:predicted naringenin-chalcone synthase